MANLHHIDLTGASTNSLPSSSNLSNIDNKNQTSNIEHFIRIITIRFINPPTIKDLLLSVPSSPYSCYHSFNLSKKEQLSHLTTTLPIQCSSHPLDSSISHQDIYMIQSSFYHASDQGEEQLLSYNGNPIPLAHNSSFTDLLTFNSPINDSIIQHVLHILHLSNSSYKYLDTNFSSSLLQKGWYYAYQKFFLHENSSRYAHSTKVKPTLCSDIILIAFFVQASHLVVIVRRFIRGIVHFFYTDDLNSLNTYDLI